MLMLLKSSLKYKIYCDVLPTRYQSICSKLRCEVWLPAHKDQRRKLNPSQPARTPIINNSFANMKNKKEEEEFSLRDL